MDWPSLLAPVALGVGALTLVMGFLNMRALRQAKHKIAMLEQRLHASEQMQSVLSRSYRA